MIILRPLYEHQIDQMIGKHFIKVLMWQRRTGKSLLLRSVVSRFDKTLFIDKEQQAYHHIKTSDDLYAYCREQLQQPLEMIAIDEIQTIDRREHAVLSLHNEYPDVELWITGSNSDMLSSELTTRLRGRYLSMTIYPFVFSEYLSYYGWVASHETMNSYIQVGNLPSLYQLSSMDSFITWKQDLIDTIMLRDIVERYTIRDVSILQDVFAFMINNAGNITNTSSLLAYLEHQKRSVSLVTLQSYIEYLCRAFILYEVPLYDVQGKEIFQRLRKYYVSDFSLRKVYFGGYDEWLGKILENLVYMTCIAYGWQVFVWRIGTQEVDFVLEKAGKKMYIQVAYLLSTKEVIDREVRSLLQIQDNYPKYIVSMDQILLWSLQWINHITLRDVETLLL